jgi:uncharacterized membrane protein YjgN (DUF898 family)
MSSSDGSRLSVPAVSAPVAATAPVIFTGRNGVFRRLVTRGALLELVTFGFYRFWLTTDIRRHLWSRTEIDGDALEYIGRARELLIGFLIALAVLVPVSLVYSLLGLEFERFKAFASLPLYLVLFAFGQFAAYRARRYRLTRTVWRGVRFWMTGSGWSYAWRSLVWGLLLFPTLGFLYPWRMAALEGFKLRHTLYGNLPGRFEATGGQLFRRVWWVWLLGLLPPLLLLGGSVMLAIAQGDNVGGRPPAYRPPQPTTALTVAGATAMIVGLLMLVALPFLHAVRRAKEWEWWAGGIRFGDLAVACGLPPGSLIGIYWKLIGMGFLFSLAFTAVVSGLIALTGPPVTAGAATGWVLANAVMVLLLLVGFGALSRIYTLQRIWRRVVDTCTVSNIAAAADVVAAGDTVGAFGEGLADGLDFGL